MDPSPHATTDLVRACRSLPHARVPVWFMRQAGRHLPEYRQARGSGSILEAIAQPELAAELTMQPVRRYGTDAAILFSDIMTPIHAIGFGVDIVTGVGPCVEHPIRTAADIERLRPLEPDTDTHHVLETIDLLVGELSVPLIGFAGAPFTIASYLIEGRPSRTYETTKALMFNDEPTWHRLAERLADIAIASVRSQIDHGVAAVQLFDSWAGALDPADYRRYALPHSRRVLEAVAASDVPSIHFGVHTGELLADFAAAGADVVGVDWRTPLDEARRRVPAGTALQGNLDPARCTAGIDAALAGAREVLARAGGHPGHVFNLGHGVLPTTDPGVLAAVVELVHEEGRVLVPTGGST